jgi:hypothetical protein
MKGINIAKLANVMSAKLQDSNKIVRAESQQFFSNLQKIIGLKGFINVIICLITNICDSSMSAP